MTAPFLVPGVDPDEVADAFVSAAVPDEFCVSSSFDPSFCRELAAAGFLLMSVRIDGTPFLLPKLHAARSVLRFGDLRAPRSALRLLSRYELRPNADFSRIVQRCAAVHGDEWLTEELREVFAALHRPGEITLPSPARPVPEGATEGPRFVSFGLYRDGQLAAGEFGAVVGVAYTSYSGYRDEDSAGTVQLILTARWLASAGFAFWDLGMPMEYKTRLGARDLPREEFLELFRAVRGTGRARGSR